MAAVAHPPAIPPGHTTVPRPHSAASNSRREPSDKARTSIEVEEPTPDNVKDEKTSPPNGPAASPSNPQRPSIRPGRSKFDLEPNPFEQSFSKSSHHSSSSLSDRTTPPRGGDATSIKHNALPPLSSLTSPAAADPTQFPWLANQSLRTGPLSPAMLAGPQNNGSASRAEGGQEGGFDTSTFRTGFTPGTGSGFTPQFGSLMNGSNFGNLPLPSPNTAAFLNAVTNATPIGEGATETMGPDPNQHHQLPPNPPSAIPPHMQPHHGLSHFNEHPTVPQETITPNTLSALTGVFNDMNRNQPPPPQNFYPQHVHPQQMQPQHNMPPVDYAQQSANAASQAANGLFLLSQAHQELAKREHEEPAKPNGKANAAGQKRKSDAAVAKPPAKKGKKNSVGPAMTPDKNGFKGESMSPNFSMSGEDDEERLGPNGKPETEEEKRKNFLERNRQAALKCRQRKKAWLNELQNKVETLSVENERLQQTVGTLHEEIQRLSSILMQHRDCGLAQPHPQAYGRPIR